MENKLLEIRDKGTFIPVLCVSVSGADGFLARRGGFGRRLILIVKLTDLETNYHSSQWGGRTMPVSHKHIENNWEIIKYGDVIDVEFILGETEAPKVSEQVEYGG
jgi:hypothetical protein